MENNKPLNYDNSNKSIKLKSLISIAVLLLLLITAFIFIFIEQNKPDPVSAAVIRSAVARQLNKDPNELTDADFASITLLEITSLQPISISDFEQNRRQFKQTKPVVFSGSSVMLPNKLITLSDIKLLEKFTNLRGLEITYISFPENNIPRWMKILASTGIFNLEDRFSINLKPLENLVNLTKLNLSHTHIKNIEPLANLTNLKKLDLSGTSVTNLEPVKRLKHLELLEIGGTQTTNFGFIKNLSNLNELFLYKTEISDLKPLSELKNLKRLVLDDTQVINLEPIKDLINLRELSLDRSSISNLEPIKNFKDLTILGLRNCPNITDKQVEDLQKTLPELQILR